MFAAITPLLLIVAFLLLLLVSLSVPIIKTIYLFKLTAKVSGLLDSGAGATARFGVWGYCISNAHETVLGIKGNIASSCSKRQLGYSFDSTLSKALGLSHIEHLINKALSAVLILHPIACALAFAAFFLSLFMLHRTRYGGTGAVSRFASVLTFIVTLLAALVATLVFILDCVFVGVTKHQIHKDTDGTVTLNWGNAVWITLGGAIALWIALFGSCAGIFAIRKSRRSAAKY